ncbi:MAG: DUF58 domain-containing protein [Planctomycetaceae bacterium]
MTGRSRWLTMLAMAGVGLGIYTNRQTLAWLSLTVLIWLFVEWLSFHWRLWFELPRLRIVRSVSGRREATGFLFASRKVVVDVRLTMKGWQTGIAPMLVVRDCLPENLSVVTGHCEHEFLIRSHEVWYRYEARVCGSGNAQLPGFRITLQDAQGFFVAQRFLSVPQTFRVLPAFANVSDTRPLIKRINSLPQHGIHRVQRAGLGSELLELREYVPGDPPKSIAWKVSARRDTLMTRQYESEVPVRVHLFIDGSISSRIGGFGCRLLDQMMFVAGSVARSAISGGDPVGAVLFDERGARRIPPAGGERGFYRLLEAMSDFSVNPPPPQQRLSPGLINATMRLCGERYSELLDPKVNQVPFTFFPLSPWKRSERFRRTQIASVLAEVYRLSPMTLLELVHDDNLMATYSQRLLADAGVSWMDPLVRTRSHGFHDGMATMEMLSKALTQAVGTAKDNEVYVVLANMLECATNISYLLPAVKVALARHHRVIFVSPTPTFRRPARTSDLPEDVTAEELLDRAEDLRTIELASRLQKALRRIGATVALSGEEQAIRMVLSETHMARDGRVSLSGVR